MRNWMIVGVCLMAAGLLLFAGVFFASGFQFSVFNTSKMEENLYVVEGSVSQVELQGDTEDVTFVRSEDGSCKVVCNERDRMKHLVSLVDGKLKIVIDDQRKWYDYIGISWGKPSVTVYLPAGAYESLFITLDTGDVRVGDAYQFYNVEITTSTGDVDCQAIVQGKLDIQTGTGKIRVKGGNPQSMTLRASTGDIKVDGVECENTVTVHSSTGDVCLRDVTCGDLTMESDTGDADLITVLASGKMTIRRSTGDVHFTRCDAGEMDVKTSTGDVTGSILSEKIFIVHTSTGKISVPESLEGGRCKINTSTGNIKITVE